jgi:hypothetical protein
MIELEKFMYLIERGYRYDKDTGLIYGSRGNVITNKRKDGYIILLNHTRAHRFAWFVVYGEVPNIIDHINRDRSDNRITNLRSVTRRENNINSNRIDNAKLYSFHKQTGKYTAQICINGKKKHIGIYDTKEEAVKARLSYEKKIIK